MWFFHRYYVDIAFLINSAGRYQLNPLVNKILARSTDYCLYPSVMLKWLGGGSTSNAGANSGSGAFDGLTHVGKMYSVNEYQVVVEEVIAEGTDYFFLLLSRCTHRYNPLPRFSQPQALGYLVTKRELMCPTHEPDY